MENSEFGSWCLRSFGRICRRPIPGKANLTRALGTGTEREANTLVQPCCHNLQELLNTLPVWLLARPRFDHARQRLRTMQALR